MRFYDIVCTAFNEEGKLEVITLSLSLSDTSKETLQGLRVGFTQSLSQQGKQLNGCKINGAAF